MKSRKAGIVFIFITLLIDCLGVGIIIPILPGLVEQFTGGGPSQASAVYGWLLAIYSIFLFLFSPLLGGLSDRYGRRPVILITLLGQAVDYAFMALAHTLPLLLIGRAFAGLCGANYSTANAYIADVTPPEKRAQGFGMVSVAFGVGFILGPALGGVLADFGLRTPFWVAGGLALLNGLYGLLVLPESLPPEHRRPLDLRRANPFIALLRLRRFPLLIGLALAFFWLELAAQLMQSIWVLYTEYRFQWHELEVGLSLAIVGLLSGLAQGVFTQPIIRLVGERNTVVYGLLVMLASFVAWGLAAQGWMMYAVLLPYVLGCTCVPAMQGAMSRQVGADEQGELQGVTMSLLSLAAIFGPLISTQLFKEFTRPGAVALLPGLPFWVGALFFGVALYLATQAYRSGMLAQPQPAEVPQPQPTH